MAVLTWYQLEGRVSSYMPPLVVGNREQESRICVRHVSFFTLYYYQLIIIPLLLLSYNECIQVNDDSGITIFCCILRIMFFRFISTKFEHPIYGSMYYLLYTRPVACMYVHGIPCIIISPTYPSNKTRKRCCCFVVVVVWAVWYTIAAVIYNRSHPKCT